MLANGHQPDRVQLAPYGIDWRLLSALPTPPPSPLVVGFIGTLAPHKGVDVLLEAFASLPDPELRLEVHGRFGDYPAFDDRLRVLAGADRRISFPGAFRRDDLHRVLGGLHVLVVPSLWRENTPFVCLEGRAAGLPIVASDLPGMAEAVPTGRGRMFRAGSSTDLARVLGDTVAEVRQRGGRLPPDRSIPDVADLFRQLRAAYAGART
jgi:glycosyltransferase involved in cell wall biosynthesis